MPNFLTYFTIVACCCMFMPCNGILFNKFGLLNTALRQQLINPAVFNVSGSVRVERVALSEVCSIPADPTNTAGFTPMCVFCPRGQVAGIRTTCDTAAPVGMISPAEFTCIINACIAALQTLVANL